MKFPKNDVVLLLGFLLLFCFGLSFLRHDHQDIFLAVGDLEPGKDTDIPSFEKRMIQSSSVQKIEDSSLQRGVVDKKGRSILSQRRQENLADLSTQQLLSYMRPLFMTKSSSAIISFLQHIPAASVFRIVRAIVTDGNIYLPSRVKMRIIFAGAQRQRIPEKKFAFFNLFAQDKRLQKGAKPLLVKAVEAGYAHLVPDILSWSKKAHVEDIADQALFYAARHDDEDPEALRELYEAGVPINSAQASTLVHELITTCFEGFSIAFLVETLGANPNHTKSGQTLLARAVDDKKIAITLELIKCGADHRHVLSKDFSRAVIQLANEVETLEMKEVVRKKMLEIS